jgi:N-acetylglucosamine-6-phosphate deacetylase
LILEKIRKVREAMRMDTGAEIAGIHMEGPFLSAEETARGSQIASNMRHPSVTELERMNQASDGSIRKMTIAPELPGSLDVIRRMDQLGIVPCAGHSTASLEQVAEAVDAGLKCATHVFNAMVPLHHRRPGLLGATLTNPTLSAELIADGQHVSPVAMDILLRCKGVNGVHLVTDNTIWAGLPNGIYADGTREIVKEDQKAFVRGGTLIGSVVGINQCVANLVQMVGCSMQDAVQMATLNPARVIGCNDRKGSLQPGSDADLLIVDEAIEVQLTMAKGKILYQARD